MEVFPPDDPQPEEVGNVPTQLEQMKAWDDFTKLEKVLQAACENNDVHSNVIESGSIPASAINDETPLIKSDIKRKWEEEIADSVESNSHKLKRMNNLVLTSEVTIELVGPKKEKCDNLPISSLLTDIVKSETKPKYEEYSFSLQPDNVEIDSKNSIEFIKIEPKSENMDEIHDVKNEIKESKPNLFTGEKKDTISEDELQCHLKLETAQDVKSENSFTEKNVENETNFSPESNALIKSEDVERFKPSESESVTADLSSHTSDVSSSLVGCCLSDEEDKSSNHDNANCADNLEKKKDKKDKKEELSDKSTKKEDKLLKKKKFERCNIRDIKLEDELDAVTLSAQKEEQERIRRLQEAQMRALQERLQQIEVEKEALTQLFSQPPTDASNLFDSTSFSESELSSDEKKTVVKRENDVVLVESSDEDKAKLQTVIQAPTEDNIIDISSSSSGNESDSEDSEKKDDDIMVLSDEGEAEGDGTAEDPNNSGAHTNDCFNLPDEEGRVLVNVGHPPEDPDIFLAPQIAKVIKPHQIGGIRFLYDNVVENLDRYKSSSGFGCILAHSMGLGKTVQVVSFVDVFLRHTPATLVLCIVPINTIQNWKAEFDMWVPPSNCVEDSQVLSGEIRPRDYNVYTLNENFKTMAARAALIAEWRKQGGVLLMGYEMYRMLALRKMPKMPVKKSKRLKKQELPIEPETNEQIKKHMDEMYEHIVIPGPDLVICDEGHRIKNSLASTSMALKSIKTRRRVVLTGYPLQNNLLEYWCMVDFVRPNYLGSRAEFCNMFERPISNGQCIDSTPRDRQLMRFRSHVLHSLLVGFVQRRGHSVLRAVLPKKEEHVLLIRMTPIQRQLYKCFVKDLLYVQQATNPLKLFAVCCKIWNHPDILYKLLQEKKAQEDIDLDIDITVTTSPAISGANCSIRKRGVGQHKSKTMQRTLKALPKLLKVQPNLNITTDSIKPKAVDFNQGNVQQMSEDVKFNSLDACKNNYVMNSQIAPGHADFSQEGTQQTFLNQFSKNTLPQSFCQNYPQSSGKSYVSNPQNTNSYVQQSNIVSSQHFSTQTSQQPLSQAQYSQSSLLQTSFEQAQNQFSQDQPQFNSETNGLEKMNYPPSQSNFSAKTVQSFPSQAETNAHYSQQSETHKQFPQSISQFSSQPDDNQDTNYPTSPQSSNQKFLQSSSYSHVSASQQAYGTQSEQQYPQQTYSTTSKQFNEEQSLQFSQQSPSTGSTTRNSQAVLYPQMANQSPHASDRSSDHTLSSDSVYQPTPQHSQFSINHPSQSYSESSPPLSQQQFPQQTSFSQHPSSQQSLQQPTSQASVVQQQFSQSSSNQQMYSQQYPQHSPEFSQTSSPQFQQQNLQSFALSQNIQPQFAPNPQSYSENSPNYPPRSSPTSVSQQTFSQSFLQGGSQYSQQPSQQFSQQNSTSQTFSNASLQHFNQQTMQTGKYGNNTSQQNSFPSQAASDGHLQFSHSPQSSGQKQLCDSSVVGGNKQQTFSQTAYPPSSQQSTESQYSQIGQNSGFDPQTSQPSTFPQTSGNSTQYTTQSSEQFSQQASNSNQFHQQSNNQASKYSQQTLQFSHQPSTQQYAQPMNQSSGYTQQSTQNSQIYSQQTTSAQYASSPPKSQFKHANQSQIPVPSSPTLYQQVSQTPASQQSTQIVSQFSQVSSFPQQSSQVQSFSAQGSQYHQQSVQSSQQFNNTTPQSPQQYLQHNAHSPKQFNQQSNQSSQYNPQVSPTVQSPQNFAQQNNQTQEFVQQPNQSAIQAHNNQQTHSPQPNALPPFNASQHKSSQQFSQQQSQSSPEFNQLESLNTQQVNQTSTSAVQLNQPPNQTSQQFSQQESQTSQICSQQTVQNPQHFSQQTNQSSQLYTQQACQSQQQFNQSTNQVSPHVNQQPSQSNHQYASNNQTSQNCNEQANLNQPYSISANQTNQIYNSSHQTYNQQVEPSQNYVQPSGQSTQQYANNNQHPQQFNQHSNQSSPQYTQKTASNSQNYTQAQCSSSQQYSQQPSQSPQQFNQQPAQSPQFSQPVQSPLQYPQQPAQSPKQYSQQTAQSPQQFPQQPVQSPQQFTQPVPSPQQFSQQPAQSPQQFSQQTVQSPQHFTQPVQSPQHFTQPAQSPQQFCQQQIPSPQQFSQLTNPSPQQFSQPTTPSPQQFSQPTTPSPQQFSQPATPSPQQFSQPTTPSPQQFTQQTVNSPQQFNQQTTHSPQFTQQPIPSPQQFSQSGCSPQQFSQQSSQSSSTQQFSHQSTPPTTTQSFTQLASSPYKQPLRSGQTASFSVPQQQSVQSSQYSNSYSQPVNQAPLKGSFQTEYQNQLLSNSSVPTTQSQGLISQNAKSTQKGTKSKQGRSKTLGPPLLPQSNIQHSVKQPPSFSVQAFQNGNPAANVSQKIMGHSTKQFQNSVKSTFQPLNASLSNQQNYTVQHIKQDSTGLYSSKCSKAVLQPMNSQSMTHDGVTIQQQQMQHNQLKPESSVMDSDQQSNSVDTAVAPFRERIDSSINYEWAVPIMKEYVLGVLENSHKMMVLFVIIAETLNMGDKLLVFSQSLSTLDLLEHFLSKIQIPKKVEDPDQIVNETWCRNKNYFRLDGSTSAQEREKLINEFNRNDNVSLFLLSTRAGCLGINLVGANRIVVMDASWNPCHDAQAVCRIYRYGQKKQCHIYRLVTDNSLEKRIYDRQVNKQGMSDRVVDELNPESNFTWKDVTTLIQDDEDDGPVLELSKFASSYSDKVLKYLVSEMSPSLSKEPFEHESLLLDRKDLKLTKQEKRLAKQSYEMAKRANMINIRTTYTYLPAGAAGGGQFIINNKQCQWVGGTTIRVLPNQSSGGGALRSGTTATPITASQSLMSSLFKQGVMVQKLTMPSNVSIPVLTPGAPPVVIPAGQDVLVLRTPKGVYLRLPDGRIIAVQLPPSLLAKTQFRPNVVTHFRPAVPKGGNASTTVINTPRGQSIGIIKQTLQCGGTVRYLGPRSTAGSATQNTRSSAPEVIDLSDDDEPSSRKIIGISNTSANSSESESGEQDKSENMQTNFLPGKQITIRKISPSQQSSFSVSGSKEKCELPQMLTKNKQITILPVNPNTQQNRQKLAPQLAQPVRVQQMLLQPQQGKRKPTQKSAAKIQMTPLLSNKNIRSQITITQPTSTPSNITSPKPRLPNSASLCKSVDMVENMNYDSGVSSPTKQNMESSTIQLSEKNQSTPTSLQSLQISKNLSISVPDSGKLPGNMMPQSLASISTMLNPSLQITPANSEKVGMSDLSQQKTACHPNVPNISITPSIQNHTLHNVQSHSKPHKNETAVTQSTISQTLSSTKSDSTESQVKTVNSESTSSSKSSTPQLISSSQSFFQQTNVAPQTSTQQLVNPPQTSFQLSSSQFSSQQLSNQPSLQQALQSSAQQLSNSNSIAFQQPTALPQSSVQQLTNSNQPSFQQSIVGQLNFHQIQQKHNSDQQSLPFSPQDSRLTLSSNHIQSQSSHLATRKRKSTNKQTSKKSQQQHSLMTQNHALQPPSSDSSQSFLHSQINDHLPENHFLNFPHHMPGTDFQPFANFSSHKPISHIQHPQPLHPLQHGQEHTLSSHLPPMSHLYVSPHLSGTSTSLPDMQPSAPRAWPVPQTAGSPFHPFSQSSPYYSSGQENNQFSFQPSSFPLPPSNIASNIGQSESRINSESGGEQIS